MYTINSLTFCPTELYFGLDVDCTLSWETSTHYLKSNQVGICKVIGLYTRTLLNNGDVGPKAQTLVETSVTKLGYFWKMFWQKNYCNSSQNLWWLYVVLQNFIFNLKLLFFWATLRKIGLFQRLVTLVATISQWEALCPSITSTCFFQIRREDKNGIHNLWINCTANKCTIKMCQK